jgi:hypothetical protein
MANSLQSTRCGFYETPHNHPEIFDDEYGAEKRKRRQFKSRRKRYRYSFASCPSYSDGIRHLKICYRPYCTGDCKAAHKEREWELIVARDQKSVLISYNPKTGQSFLTVL